MTHLHELTHALTDAPRPRPRPGSPEELDFVPLRVALYREGESEPYAFAEVEWFALHHYRGPEEPAECVFGIVAPPDPELAAELAAEIERLRGLVRGLDDRVAAQTAWLAKRAEKNGTTGAGSFQS